jgi:16S rRNA processing protein RimM
LLAEGGLGRPFHLRESVVTGSETKFVRVGKVKDAHGIRGEIFVVLFAGEAAWLDQLESIRLVSDRSTSDGAISQKDPNETREFKVKSARLHKNGLIIKSSDIVDRNMAESLKGLLLEIPSAFLVSAPGETIYLSEVKGFRVITEQQGEVGCITAFWNNGAQDLLVVTAQNGTEYDIPFVEDFVAHIDFEAGKVHMNLPYGLLGEESDTDTAETDDQDEENDESHFVDDEAKD